MPIRPFRNRVGACVGAVLSLCALSACLDESALEPAPDSKRATPADSLGGPVILPPVNRPYGPTDYPGMGPTLSAQAILDSLYAECAALISRDSAGARVEVDADYLLKECAPGTEACRKGAVRGIPRARKKSRSAGSLGGRRFRCACNSAYDAEGRDTEEPFKMVY